MCFYYIHLRKEKQDKKAERTVIYGAHLIEFPSFLFCFVHSFGDNGRIQQHIADYETKNGIRGRQSHQESGMKKL